MSWEPFEIFSSTDPESDTPSDIPPFNYRIRRLFKDPLTVRTVMLDHTITEKLKKRSFLHYFEKKRPPKKHSE